MEEDRYIRVFEFCEEEEEEEEECILV